MFEIMQFNDIEAVNYYLLNHPQNSIVKELTQTDNLEYSCKNHNLLICFRALLKEEKKNSENKVKFYLGKAFCLYLFKRV